MAYSRLPPPPAQRGQPVQRVVGVSVCAAVRRGEARAVRIRVVAVRIRVWRARQEAVRGGRAGQPPHVVIGERVRPGRIVHLQNLADEVVGVLRADCAGFILLSQTVQCVVNVLNRVAVPVCLAREVVVRVVLIRLDIARRKRGFRHAAKGVVSETGSVLIRIGDRDGLRTGYLRQSPLR